MKKFLSCILALVLILSMSITAFAAENDIGGTDQSDSGDIKVIYSKTVLDTETVYHIDIAWGSMEFNYNSGMIQEWDPENLKYVIKAPDGGAVPTWTPAEEKGDTVTVTNHSNAAVGISITYTKDTTNGVDGTVVNGGFSLGSADNGENGAAGTATSDSATLSLSTENLPESFKAGSSKVTVGSLAVTIENDLSIDATAMTADELNAAVAGQLAKGYTDITVTLAAYANAEMFTAIRRAICDTEGVADGSIDLTLKGATSIPDAYSSVYKASIFGPLKVDGNEEDLSETEYVTQLASISLPDVTEIGDYTFYNCTNLTSLYAPKAQTIGQYAFYCTGLTKIDLPELKTLGLGTFYGCSSATEVRLPNVTYLGYASLELKSESETTVYLTSEDDIVADYDCWFSGPTNINLVLNSNKQIQVSGNTWTTWDEDGNEMVSFTFKSITFEGEATE